MAATVGELVVNLIARTGQFDRNLNKSGRNVKQFSRTSETAARVIGRLGTAFVGAFSAGKVISWLREGAQQIDAMAKASRALDLTINQLQAVHLAAEKAGTSTKTVEMAVQRMVRRLAEAKQGRGEALVALEMLGLDPKKLGAQSAFQALRTIADAMNQVEDANTRLLIAFKLFDSEGARPMVELLSQGSKGLDEMKRKMSGLASMSEQTAANIEQLNDAMTEIGFVGTRGGRNKFIGTVADLTREFQFQQQQAGGFWQRALLASPLGGAAFIRNMLRGSAYEHDLMQKYNRADWIPDKEWKRKEAAKFIEEPLFGPDPKLVGRARSLFERLMAEQRQPIPLAAAAGVGSADWYSSMVRQNLPDRGEMQQKQMVDLVKRQLDQDRERNRLIQRMIDELDLPEIEIE